MSVAGTPEPPYVAVIFTSVRTDGDAGYAAMSERMAALAAEQPGYLGIEAARDRVGITVSYWADEADARAWKQVAEHLVALLECEPSPLEADLADAVDAGRFAGRAPDPAAAGGSE